MFRARLADGDERRRLRQSVNMCDRPAQLFFESLDGGSRGRRTGGNNANSFRREVTKIFGAFANEIKTVGAAQIIVTCSSPSIQRQRADRLWADRRGSLPRR